MSIPNKSAAPPPSAQSDLAKAAKVSNAVTPPKYAPPNKQK